MARLKKLEEAQQQTVDAKLAEIRQLISSKAVAFNKDHMMDLLLGLKLVARETKHSKASYYATVLEAMREKLSSPDDQIKKYVSLLLGDKDYERVMEAMAKVDKATKASAARSSTSTVGRSGRGGRFGNVQCFQCQAYGHYKSHCPQRPSGRQPQADLLVLGLFNYKCVVFMD